MYAVGSLQPGNYNLVWKHTTKISKNMASFKCTHIATMIISEAVEDLTMMYKHTS